ncbi:PLP-dependent aminotransferase family protein [Aliifodinibius sp. S!AR15-10]|uniref:aminotransferase-like domain-containing protein n=1 Tax=Aliifodinibius sp. S!AR15-10 TaxID=2950437 RepID=UPI00285E46B2|nr:PLP-dependent aminotransferase family protein [Aliifodinibius sp. S!AR15-10]MDR8393742.1 PLP-dependent aminotransferase family protein [Aliifodinibius sp. S!AR15-10]
MQDLEILKNLIEIDRDSERAVYLQVAQSFVRNIRRGRLRKGLKLPGTRKVADLLGINRMTMVAAFDELKAQGWIETVPRKETFVKRDLPDITPKRFAREKEISHFPREASFPVNTDRVVQFPQSNFQVVGKLMIDDGFPDTRLAPVDRLMQSMRSISRKPVYKKYLRYGGPLGTDRLRETLANYLADTRGLPLSTENIMITRGAQMGINLAARLLLQPGDDIIMTEPSFFGAQLTFQQRKAVINRVPVDEQGMDLDAVERLCQQKDIKLIYVVPHHHFPTTVTLTPKRRIKLLDLAKEHRFAIIEDDYDYDFHYASSPMLPMASLDQHGSVIYIGTLTKTLAPSIRIGFTLGAENYIAAASHLRRTIDWQGDSLRELAIAELYRDGTISRHIKKSVKTYRKRWDHFCGLLESHLGGHVTFAKPEGGMSVWTTFRDCDLKKLSANASEKGLIMGDGELFNTEEHNYNSARLGFASLNVEEQEKAVKILASCLPGL